MMVSGDGLHPPQPKPNDADENNTNELGNFMATQDNHPRPKLQAQTSSADDSLFGNFIKSRIASVTAEGDSMHSDIDEPLQQQQQRQSENKSPIASREKESQRRSPKSPRGKSPKTRRRSNSPRSPSSKKDNISKSGTFSRRSKSPRSPNTSSSTSKRDGAPQKPRSSNLSPRSITSSQKSPNRSPGRPTIKAAAAVPFGSPEPPLLDDSSVVRETVAGFRGGKQWNIMEDTPGGHAAEKLVIVQGVEVFDDDISGDNGRFQLPEEEEDDSIVEDDEEFVEDSRNDDLDGNSSVARTFRTKSLPSDPGSGVGSSPRVSKSRFDPAFANSEMWTTDDDASLQKYMVGRFNSGDFSLISTLDKERSRTNRSAVSSHGMSTTTEEISEHISEHDEIDDDNHTGGNLSSVDRTKTPTEKRSGGRRQMPEADDVDSLPNLHDNVASDLAEDDEIDEAEDDLLARHPASVPEDGPLGAKKKSSSASRRKKKSSTVKESSSSRRTTSRSSNKRTGGSSQRRKSDALDRSAARFSGRDQRRISDVVPCTPVREISSYVRSVKSPLSSSLTSTPNSLSNSRSWVSSIRQQASLQVQQQPHNNSRDSPRRRKNKPLRLYMESNRPQDTSHDDEHTLGASTITTNFSTTQRTIGENTVSTRSLFRSEPMPVSETLQIPRRRADSDNSVEDKVGGDNEGAGAITRPEALTAFDVMGEPNESTELMEDPTDQNQIKKKVGNPNSMGRSTLRRPSGDHDDLLVGATGLDDFSEDSSSASNSVQKRQSPSFLQLDPNSLGLKMNPPSELNPAPDEGATATEPDDMNMPELTDWKETPDSEPMSPGASSAKRRFTLNPFKRGKSWKGAVPLSDDEGD